MPGVLPPVGQQRHDHPTVSQAFALVLLLVGPPMYGMWHGVYVYKGLPTVAIWWIPMADLSERTESTINSVLGFIVVLALLGGTIALVFTNLDTLVEAF